MAEGPGPAVCKHHARMWRPPRKEVKWGNFKLACHGWTEPVERSRSQDLADVALLERTREDGNV